MKRWWLVLALLLSLGVNVGILATFAVSRWRSRTPPPPSPQAIQKQVDQRLAELADRLELQGEDRRRFLELQHRFVNATAPDRKRFQQVHRDLRRELIAAHPDPARVETLTAESSQLYLQIARAVTANMLEIRHSLTPAQESRFLALVENAKPGQLPFAPPGAPGPVWRRGGELRQRLRQERAGRPDAPPVQP